MLDLFKNKQQRVFVKKGTSHSATVAYLSALNSRLVGTGEEKYRISPRFIL